MTQMTLISMSFAKGTSEERGYKLGTLFKKVKYAYCCFSISVQSLALTPFWRRAEVLPVSSSPSEENGLSHCKTHLYFRQSG